MGSGGADAAHLAPHMVPHHGTPPNCHGGWRKPASTQSACSAVQVATADHVSCTVVRKGQEGGGRFGVGEQRRGLGPEETEFWQLLRSWRSLLG